MYLGTLTAEDAKLNITYTYRKRGMDKPYYPDLIKEKDFKDFYTVSDSLFTDYIGFDGRELLYRSVDIIITLQRNCFVDTLSLNQGDESELEKIEILTKSAKSTELIGKYHGESGSTISKKHIVIPVGVNTDNLIIRLKCSCRHIIIGKLDILGAADLDEAIYPPPKSISYFDGYMKNISAIVAKNDDEIFAARYFMEKSGIHAKLIPELPDGDLKHTLSFNITDNLSDCYSIAVDERYTTVFGTDRLALIWAAKKLVQLKCENGIRCCRISDTPYMEIRGVHIGLPDRDKIDFLKRFVKYMLVPLGYNTVFIQLSAAMEYKRHPEINASWLDAVEKYEKGLIPKPAHYEFLSHDVLTHEEITDICDYIRSFGLDIIPEVQTLGHTQYITMSHPELGETEAGADVKIDLFTQDVKPEDYFIHCMCPAHEDYYKMTFDIIDEVIEVIKPKKYLHIGHDEIYTIGKCPRCANTPAHIIYADEVNALNRYIKSKGLITMLWSDMMQEQKYETCSAIDLIDKDIICLSFTWYFHLDDDVEDILHEHGFKVMLGNFYSSHYPRFNQRKKKGTILGAEISTWVWCNEQSYAFDGKLFDLMYSSAMLWNESYDDRLRLTYSEIIKNIYKNYGKYLGDGYIEGERLELPFKKTIASVPCDIRHKYDSALYVGCGESISIDTDITAKKIAFLHSTDKDGERIVWQTPKQHGIYTLVYDDGTSYDIPILYGANINEYKYRWAYPIKSDMYRHEGYTATCLGEPYTGKTLNGEDYTLLEYTVANPYPQKRICTVKLTHTADSDAGIILYNIGVSL